MPTPKPYAASITDPCARTGCTNRVEWWDERRKQYLCDYHKTKEEGKSGKDVPPWRFKCIP